jgi:hypothetical protein
MYCTTVKTKLIYNLTTCSATTLLIVVRYYILPDDRLFRLKHVVRKFVMYVIKHSYLWSTVFPLPHPIKSYWRHYKAKRQVIPVHAMNAYRGRKGIAPLILNLGYSSRCVHNITPPLHHEKQWPLNRKLRSSQPSALSLNRLRYPESRWRSENTKTHILIFRSPCISLRVKECRPFIGPFFKETAIRPHVYLYLVKSASTSIKHSDSVP